MVRKSLPILIAGAVAALVVGGVSGASSSEGSSERNFTLIEVEGSVAFIDVDNSQSGPTIGDELTALAEAAPDYEASGIRVAVSAVETTTICNDKHATCKTLAARGIELTSRYAR